MTTRDRMIIVVVLIVAALGAFWFVGLAPKRKEAADLQTKVAAAQQQLTDAEQKASQGRHAKAAYTDDYSVVATLGKAVPKSDALPSLLYQLQHAAAGARIDFNSLKVASSTGTAAPAPASAAVPSASGGAASGSAPSASGSSGAAAPSSAKDSKSSGAAAPAAPAATPATATQAATSALPPGAVVGSAGFPTMPFSFAFAGTFFDMEHFLDEVQRFVRVNGDKVDVSGRLLAIDGFGLSAGPGGFPNVKASITATAYLRSPQDDVAPTQSSATTSGSSSAAPASSAAAPAAGVSQ